MDIFGDLAGDDGEFTRNFDLWGLAPSTPTVRTKGSISRGAEDDV